MRINLSEQTDMMDLLGADLPLEGAPPGTFAWCAPVSAQYKGDLWLNTKSNRVHSTSICYATLLTFLCAP